MTHHAHATANGHTAEWPTVEPVVNIFESENEIRLEAEMPGLPKDAMGIELEGDELVLTGKPAPSPELAGFTPVLAERAPAEYRRGFVLGADIDREKIRAKYENGILTVTLPKHERAKPRRIAVE